MADFYNGRQVNLIVGYGTGGGYDVYGRLLARHLGRHIPGNPNVVVQNMPGAGCLRAVNFIANSAPKDGSAIATFARDMPLLAIIGHNPNVRFDARNVHLARLVVELRQRRLLPVRAQGRGGDVDRGCAPAAAGRRSFSAAPARARPATTCAMLLRDALGLNIRLITGYPDGAGSSSRSTARNSTAAWSGYRRPRRRIRVAQPDSDMRKLLQFARARAIRTIPTYRPHASLRPTTRTRALIALAELPYRLSRPFAAPPGIPPDRARALQAAFLAVQRDPLYLDDAARLKVDVSPIGGHDVLRAIDEIAAAPPTCST